MSMNNSDDVLSRSTQYMSVTDRQTDGHLPMSGTALTHSFVW